MKEGPYSTHITILECIAKTREPQGDPIKQSIDYILSNLSLNTTQDFFATMRDSINPMLDKMLQYSTKYTKDLVQKDIETLNSALDELAHALPLVSPRVLYNDESSLLTDSSSEDSVDNRGPTTKALIFSESTSNKKHVRFEPVKDSDKTTQKRGCCYSHK